MEFNSNGPAVLVVDNNVVYIRDYDSLTTKQIWAINEHNSLPAAERAFNLDELLSSL